MSHLDHILMMMDHVLTMIDHVLTIIDHVLTMIDHVLTMIGHVMTMIGHVMMMIDHVLMMIDHRMKVWLGVYKNQIHQMDTCFHGNGIYIRTEKDMLLSLVRCRARQAMPLTSDGLNGIVRVPCH